MFPLLTLIVGANNDLRGGPTLNPIDQAQQEAVVRVVDCVRANADQRALPDFPGPGAVEAMTHAGNHEETIKVVQVSFQKATQITCKTVTRQSASGLERCVCGHSSELTHLKDHLTRGHGTASIEQ